MKLQSKNVKLIVTWRIHNALDEPSSVVPYTAYTYEHNVVVETARIIAKFTTCPN